MRNLKVFIKKKRDRDQGMRGKKQSKNQRGYSETTDQDIYSS